ncbi:MAG: nucleoside deaminase, partial [bacterium]
GEVPIAALLILEDGSIFESYNQIEATGDPTAHAERLVISEASKKFGRHSLANSTLYVNLEPCPMCAGAMVQARVGRLCFAARDERYGGCRSIYRITDDPRLNHRLTITEGILRDESILLLKGFFEQRRLHSDDQIV